MGFGGNTSIIMYDGTTKCIKDINIGDKIMNINGSYQKVTKITKNKSEMYDIIPIKGTKYTIAKDHKLLLKKSNSSTTGWDERDKRYRIQWLEKFSIKSKSFMVVTYGNKSNAYNALVQFQKNELPLLKSHTKYGTIISSRVNEFNGLSKSIKQMYKGFTTGINFAESELEIDPYILGYWLGDGASSCTQITTAEWEIRKYFNYYAKENNQTFKKVGKSKYDYNLSSGQNGKHGRNLFLNFLKKNNLINNKHIPKDYLMNSRENRLKLLAGLVDSDGHNTCNTYDFTLKSKKLADDIILLARSLGFKAFGKEVKKTCTNSKNGPVTGTYYRFFIHGEGLDEVPSLLERKQCHERKQIKNASVTGITIKPIGIQECYTLKTTGNKLLLDDFTLIHK